MKYWTILLAVGLWLLTDSEALAHPHHQAPLKSEGGFQAGFAHPWLGLDHLLAMVGVGLLAVRLGGRALWILPAAFLGLMAVGGVLGMAGFHLQRAEFGIALSLLVLGVALASGRQWPLLGAALATGLMGAVHGHAHGSELPALAAPALYALGFVAATLLLHLGGILAGRWCVRPQSRLPWLRFCGGGISLVGLLLILGVL